MSTQSVETKVEQVDINLDELFDGTASASSVTVPADQDKDAKKVNIFSKEKPADFSFADPSSRIAIAVVGT